MFFYFALACVTMEPDKPAGEAATDDTGSHSGVPHDTGPIDADVDGFTDDIDCNDADARIYPGAVEVCDALDRDCDGEALSEGVCGVATTIAAATQTIGGGEGTYGFSDVTADGVDDLVWTSLLFPDPDGHERYGWALYDTFPAPGEERLAPTGAGRMWLEGDQTCMADVTWLDVADTDGDGFNDLALVSHDCDWGVYVHSGPFALDGSTNWISDADHIWRAPIPDRENWMWETAVGGDLDGDGLDDMVGTSGGDYDDPGVCAFDVFLGGVWDAPVARVSDIAPNGLTYSAMYVHVLDDTDGDGMAEVEAALGSGVHAFIRGADAVAGDGALATDLAYAILAGHPNDAVDDIWGESNIGTVGDWNGDGTPDIVAVATHSATLGYEHGEVFLLDGSLRGELSVDDALGSWVGTEGDVRFLGQLDADGDSGPELLVQDRDHGTHVLRHSLPSMRTPLDGIVLTDPAITRGSTGDFNADGYDDWVVGDLTAKTQNIWFGFDIPWDDARYW